MKNVASIIALFAALTFTSLASAQSITNYKFGMTIEVVNNGQMTGLQVRTLHPHGPAEQAGVRVGDVIIESNNRKFDGAFQASQAIERLVRSVRVANGKPTANLHIKRYGQCVHLCVHPTPIVICVKPPVNPWQPVAPPSCNTGGGGVPAF